MLYVASLKLVCLKGGKLLTDVERNHLSEFSDSNDALNTSDNHAAGCLGLADGKVLYLY